MSEQRPSPSEFIAGGNANPPAAPSRPSPSQFIAGGGSVPNATLSIVANQLRQKNPDAVGSDVDIINDELRRNPSFAGVSGLTTNTGYQLRNANGFKQLVKSDNNLGNVVAGSIAAKQGANNADLNVLNSSPEDKALWVAKTLAPIFAGGAGAYGTKAGWGIGKRLAATGLAGATGEALNQGYQGFSNAPDAPKDAQEAINRMLEQGGVQALFEGLGSAISAPGRRLIAGSDALKIKPGMTPDEIAQVVRNQRTANLNDAVGLHLTPGEITQTRPAQNLQKATTKGILGQFPANAAQGAGEDNALAYTNELLNQITQARTEPLQTGEDLGAAIQRGHAQFKQNYANEINNIKDIAKQNGITVDMAPVQKLGMSDLQNFGNLQKILVDNPLAETTPDEKKVLSGMLMTGNTQKIPFEAAKQLQERLGQMMDSPEMMQSPSRAFMSKYYSALQDAMGDSLNQYSGSLGARYQKWRQGYAQGAQLFGDAPLSRLADLAKTEPEKVAAAIGPSDVSKISALKDALTKYNGNPAVTSQNMEAWKTFQRQYTQNLLNAPNGLVDASGNRINGADLFSLKDRLTQAGPQALGKVFGNNPVVLQNLSDLAEAMSRVQKVNPGANNYLTNRLIFELGGMVAGAGIGQAGHVAQAIGGAEATSYLISKVLYSKYATQLLTRGVSGLMQASGSAAMQAGGRGLDAVSPYFATATADILRAFQIAQSLPEAKNTSSASPR